MARAQRPSDHRTVALLRRLIAIESCDPPGRELEIAGFVCEVLAGHGIAATLSEFAPGRANVLGRIAGTGVRPALVFSAHMDTLPVGAQPWRHPPFAGTRAGGRLYGRGAADMKSGLAAMIVAAAALSAEGTALGGDLLLAFSAGESSRCLGAREFVRSGALAGAGALLVGEPSSLRVLIAETGALWLRLSASGRSGHASAGANGDGNAIVTLTAALARLGGYDHGVAAHPLLGAPSLSVGTIHGGTAVNLTPDRCVAELDLRLLPGQDPEAAIARLGARVGPEIAIETIDHKPAVEIAPDHPFVGVCQEACAAELGVPAPPGGASYFSDSAVLVPSLGLPRAIIGPGDLGQSGQPDESVAVAKLLAAVRIYRRIARAWLSA